MLSNSTWFFAAFCAGLALLVCATAKPLCQALRLLDHPSERKRHREPTPLAGGLVILIAIVPLLTLAMLTGRMPLPRHVASIFISVVTAVTAIGLSDDRHGHSAWKRFLLVIALFAAAAVVEPIFLVRLLHFEHPGFELGLLFPPLAIVFTSFCLAGLVNAVNMADGKNGLVIGLCLGWLALLSTRAPAELELPIVLLMGALLVLLVFNLQGKLFLGDGGAYGFSAAIGLLVIAIYNSPGSHPVRAISAEEVLVLFAVPIGDMFRLMFVRWRRGTSPAEPGRDHLHHRLLDLFGWPGGLFAYWVLALVPATLLIIFA